MKTFQTFDISAEYDAIHRTFPCHKDAPVIGLTGNFQEEPVLYWKDISLPF